MQPRGRRCNPALERHNFPDFATAVVIALGYAAWNRALRTGNLMMLAAISYTSLGLSALLGSLLLSTTLQLSFWQDAVMVTISSFIYWRASRRG